MLRTRAQGQEVRYRSVEGGVETKSARSPKGVVDAMWKMGETWAGIEKRRQEGLVQ